MVRRATATAGLAVANVTRCRQLTVESKICRDLPSDLTVERRSNDQGRVSTLCRNPSYLGLLVGVAGFEPAASSSRTKRAAKLRHTPPASSGA
jgi:hypothetical protein